MDSTSSSRFSQSRPGIWLAIARVFQVAVICLTVGLFIASLPVNYEHRLRVCTTDPCPPGEVTLAGQQTLEEIGISLDVFVKLTIALDILIAAVYTTSAVIILVRKPNDLLTIFVTIMLVTFGVATFTGNISGLAAQNPRLRWLTDGIEMIGNCAIIAFLLIFPSGRFVPRWTVAILLGWVLFQLPRYYFPDSPLNTMVSNPLLYNILFIGGVISGPATQIYRYWRVSDPIARQQTKWVIYGLTIGLGGYIAVRAGGIGLADPLGSNLPISLGLAVLSVLFMLLLPVSISIAVLRYRLWEINPIINRTLVYGALSASTIALYVVAVGFFSSYFQNRTANYIVSFIATGFIAILFEPLRERLQRSVNRLMYGERDDPGTILARLSQRIDAALAPDAVLPTIVETLAQTLRLPYAAITLDALGDEHRIAAEFGQPASNLVRLPLSYQAEQVGELLLAPRAPGETFSTADMNLLNIIVHQAGAAAHTVKLTAELHQLNADLQRSRQTLVTAQEEERRRLRRDLHDGVGPTLASLSQRIDTAADLVLNDPQASIDSLKQLKSQVKGTIAEIRRLVYALRPPVLDEFGLVSAIREHVAPYMGPNGLAITFDVSEPLPALPAAVEVAAYRIALEAFTNLVQYAHARACRISIKLEHQKLFLEVSDDGIGIDADAHAGVGLASMRERANELGGECVVERCPAGGTRVIARLPIARE